MYPPNPLLQLVPARLPQAIDRVRSLVWKKLVDVTQISATDPSPEYFGIPAARKLKWSVVTGPHHYGKLWDQRWFRLQLPRVSVGQPVYLKWDDQAEATLYAKGTPHYGFDVAHRYAPVPAGSRQVWIESIVCQTGVWHPAATGLDPEGSRFEGAALFARNALAWEVLHDFLVLDDLMRAEVREAFPGREKEFETFVTRPSVDVIRPLLRRLLRFLDDAVNALDAGGLAEAKKSLAFAFKELPGDGAALTAHLTGHSHIDLVWLWPERVGEFKAVHTFATMHRLMEGYPEFRFAYSQPASYAAVQRRAPSLYESTRERIREGRWEAHGATEVESDTLIACGEALARSFLIGQEGFLSISGSPSSVLWLPDAFGFSACLPQIMRETGVSSFFTGKLSWNAINAFPYTSFVWAGADGSEVIAHNIFNTGYDQSETAQGLRATQNAHRQCDVHPEFLMPCGYGDGGGGVSEEMCERARRVADLAGVPAAKWGRIDEFFERLHAIREKLPVYQGELYFEYHRGTYTTQSGIKAGMRAAERALQIQEAAHCVASSGPIAKAAWKRVVFAQFHDYIPGSSIHEVYLEAGEELAAIGSRALAAARKKLETARTSRKEKSIFNPLPHPRIHFHGGKALLLPPLAGAAVSQLSEVSLACVEATARSLSNGRVNARFDAMGRIASLTIDGIKIPFSHPANELFLFPEHPHNFGAWDIDRQSLSLGKPDARKAVAQVARDDVYNAEVSFSRPLGKKSRITTRYRLAAGSPALEIIYDLDWQEEFHLLKAVFPTLFMGRDARFAAPFGSVRRPQLGGTPTAEAMWEVPASRWAIVSDDSESKGFFLVTEAKYGFSCRNGQLGLSLVRSAQIPSEDRGHKRGSHPEPIRRTLAPQVVSDIGRHVVAVAIGRFDPAAPCHEQPAALAEILFTPVQPYTGGPLGCGFLGLEGDPSLQPVWAQPLSAGKWILRLHETLGRSGETALRLAAGWRARLIDLSGRPLGGGKPVRRIPFSAYKIISVEISRE